MLVTMPTVGSRTDASPTGGLRSPLRATSPLTKATYATKKGRFEKRPFLTLYFLAKTQSRWIWKLMRKSTVSTITLRMDSLRKVRR